MALIKPGVWHENVWVSRTWQEDLWLEYGTYVPPVEEFVAIQIWPKRKLRFFERYPELLYWLREWLKLEE